MSVILTPIQEDSKIEDAKHIVLIDLQGKKRKADLHIAIESEKFQCQYYAFTGFHFIGGAPVFSAGKTDLNKSNRLLPLDNEELEMVTEIMQAGFDQVLQEMKDEHPVLSKCLPWFLNPTFSASRAATSIIVESIEKAYSYYLK